MSASKHKLAATPVALNEISTDQFELEIERGWAEMAHRNINQAKVHFFKAHALGHDDTLRHIRSHVGLLSVFLRRFHIMEIAKQTASIVILLGIYCCRRLFNTDRAARGT